MPKNKSRFFSYLLIASIASTGSAELGFAKTKKKPSRAPATKQTLPKAVALPSPYTTAPTLLSIDVARENLYRAKGTEKAKAVVKALQALKSQKFVEAKKLAASLKSDPLFADYFAGIQAIALRSEAQIALQAKKPDKAAAAAKSAIQSMLQIESEYPYSSFYRKFSDDLAKVEVLLGTAYFDKGGWTQSQLAFERAFQRSTNLTQLQSDVFEKYSTACKKQPGSLCSAWIQRFFIAFPKGAEETKPVAKLFPDLAEKTATSKAYPKSTQVYKAPDLDQSAFEAAMNLYLDEKYGDAIKGLQRFLDEFPKSSLRFRARYWLAQALTHKQDHQKAQRVYEELIKDSPLSYYGYLASSALGKNLDSYIDARLPMVITSDPFLHPTELMRIRRAEKFIAVKAFDAAAQDLKEVRVRPQFSNEFLTYLAMLNYEAQNHNSSFQVLTELIQRNYEPVFSSFGLRLIFPVTFLDLVKRNAEQQKVDPILVLSLIKQESAFEASAVSGSGASGLMQLMSFTAVETEPTIKQADLTEPEHNIRVGTKYLKKMLVKYNGNIVFSLAAYNAGPNAVDRWIREGKSTKGMLEFIESIPYKETREYVGSIIRNYFWYSKKLGTEPGKSLGYFWNVYGPPETPPPNGGSTPENPESAPSESKPQNGSA